MKEEMKSLCCDVARYPTKMNVLSCMKRKLPILVWLPNYKISYLYPDIISGITVGLMAIPQCLAYGDLAGLSPVSGLYAGMLCPFIYTLFGGSKDLSISPVSVVSLIVAQYTLSSDENENVIYASGLAFVAGIIIMLLGLLNLGVLISFISVPVLSGYVSSVGVSVILLMTKDLLGLKLPRSTLVVTLVNICKNIRDTRPADISLGIGCLLIFVGLEKLSRWNRRRNTGVNSSMKMRIISKTIWIICSAKYFLVIMIMTFISQFLVEVLKKDTVFTMVGKMEEGFPKPYVPIQAYKRNTNATVSTSELLQNIGTGSVTVALVALLNTMVAVKTVGNLNNYRLDMSQEMFTIGLITFTVSFFRGFSVAGSLSRTLLSSQCGVRTQLNGIFAGLVLVVSLSILTSWFRFIPRAALAAMVIMALSRMVDLKMICWLWKGRRIELIPLTVAFLTTFYNPVIGILVGTLLHFFLFTFYNTVLKFSIEHTDEACIVQLKIQNLLYPSVEQLVNKLEELKLSNSEKDLVLDFSSVSRIDATVATALKKAIKSRQLLLAKERIYLVNVSTDIFSCLEKLDIDTSVVVSSYPPFNSEEVAESPKIMNNWV